MKNEDNKEKFNKMVEEIDQDGENLSPWEVRFISSLVDNPPRYYTEKQIEIISRIYDEKMN